MKSQKYYRKRHDIVLRIVRKEIEELLTQDGDDSDYVIYNQLAEEIAHLRERVHDLMDDAGFEMKLHY